MWAQFEGILHCGSHFKCYEDIFKKKIYTGNAQKTPDQICPAFWLRQVKLYGRWIIIYSEF
jgi:hypothetical protein